MKCFAIFLAVLCIVPVMPAGFATAQTPTKIGSGKDWHAYTYKDGKKTICYMASVPIKKQGNYTRRGDPFALVTNRPADRVRGEVNFVAGYTFKPASEVTVTIGKQTFRLFTANDRAWSRDKATDRKIVAAMVRGSRMIVRGISSRGTRTTDTYSLSGVTATRKIIDQACRG